MLKFLFLFILTGCSRCSQILPDSSLWSPKVTIESLVAYDGKPLFHFKSLDQTTLAMTGDFKVFFKDIENDNYLKSLMEQERSLEEQISKKELDSKSYLLGGVKTKIFQRKLDLAEEMIKEYALKLEADNLGISRNQYISKYIYDKSKLNISDNDIEAYLKKNLSPNGDKKEWAMRRIFQANEKKYLNYTLEKHILHLPIIVNLTPPQFKIETQSEWTPYWGSENVSHKVIIFSGAKNYGDKLLIENLLELKSKYKNLYVAYRPIVRGGFQELAAYIHVCVWNLYPDQFWNFFLQTVGDYKEKTEGKMYSVAQKMPIDESLLKSCVLDKRYEDIVEYHKKYAKHLQISSGPVVFVSGEVLYGSVRVEDIDRVLKRRMNLPYAGSWQ